MVFFVATILVAIVVVLVTKGSFEALGSMKLRALWLLLTALVVQVVLEVVDFPSDRIDDLGLALLLASYALIFAFCYANRSIRAMPIVVVGVALNVLVIALNGGMPTKDDVRERHGHEVRVPIERTVKHKPREPDDTLPFLGDVITAPGFPNQQFSVGDIVIGIGIVVICYDGSRPRQRPTYASEPDRSPTA